MLSGFTPTAVEQYYLTLLNDARFNPGAYGVSLGIDLSTVAASQPLAMNPLLVESARLHSQDMIAQNYFAHVTPLGVDPGGRIAQTGFVANGWAESIETNTQPSAYGGGFPANYAATDAAYSLSNLIVDQGVSDLGHRIMLLDIGGQDALMRQVGIGIASQVTQGYNIPFAYQQTDTTIDLAGSSYTGAYLTGVVFNDLAGNGEYQPGEGLGGVTISVAGVGTTTTMDAGGYSIPLAPGTYTVTASGGGLASPIARTVDVGNSNVLLNFDTNPNGATLVAGPSGVADGTLGTFSAMSAGDTASSYSAKIDWGNGNTSFAMLTPNANGTFGVQGANLYAAPGVYEVRVLVTHLSDGKTVAINATAVVNETVQASTGGAGVGGGGSGTGSFLGTTSGNPTVASHGRHVQNHGKFHRIVRHLPHFTQRHAIRRHALTIGRGHHGPRIPLVFVAPDTTRPPGFPRFS